jgi:tol-pal system protein YbgF
MTRKNHLLAMALCAAFCAPIARAGLFDDSEARQQVTDLKAESEQRFDALTGKVLDLETRILGLQDELAQLRGQLETLTYESEQSRKRVQDFYLDLDQRLVRLEGGDGLAQSGADASPQTEAQAYDAALSLFKEGKFAEAAKAFELFTDTWPDSEMAANAMFWLGNSFYAQNNCKEAIAAQETLISRWSDSPRVPDAMLAIADCQRDSGNVSSARNTLNTLVARHAGTQAAIKAKERLNQLR